MLKWSLEVTSRERCEYPPEFQFLESQLKAGNVDFFFEKATIEKQGFIVGMSCIQNK